MTGSGILVNKAFVDCLVDQRNGRVKQLGALCLVRMRQSISQALDLSAELASITSVDQVPLFVLSNPFFCRFMICHSIKNKKTYLITNFTLYALTKKLSSD